MTDDRARTVQSALVLFGQLGSILHDAIARELGSITGNEAVATLFQLEVAGPMRPSQIQALTGLSSGGVTKMLDRLEAAGLVLRDYGTFAGDRRASVVLLTHEGHVSCGRVADSILAVVDEIRVLLKDVERTLG